MELDILQCKNKTLSVLSGGQAMYSNRDSDLKHQHLKHIFGISVL